LACIIGTLTAKDSTVTSDQGKSQLPRPQRWAEIGGITIVVVIILIIISTVVYNRKTVDDRQLTYERTLITQGVQDVRRHSETNQFYGSVGTCSFIIVIKNDLNPVRAVFYLDNDGDLSFLDPPFATPVLDDEIFLPDAPKFGECS